MNSILVFSEKYWPYGGAELATHLILKLLRDEGFDITVVTGTIKLEPIGGIRYIYSSSLDTSSKIHLWKNLIELRSARWLNELVKRSDLIYITRLAYPFIPLAKKYKKKVVVHLHNYQPIAYCSVILHPYKENHDASFLRDVKASLRFEILEHESPCKALLSSLATPLNRLSRLWTAEADEVICVSKRQAEIIRREASELAKKVMVIYNPLPNIQFPNLKTVNEPCFLYVGGSSYLKGVHILAEASTQLLKHNKCKFMLTNMTGRRWQPLFKALNNLFNGSFSMFNRLSYESLLRMHSEVTALVFPSIWEEPLPYSILEAMLAGTIPIASRTGGIPEIVQGTFAEKTLFTPSSVDELIDRMEFTLSLSHEQLANIGFGLREQLLKKNNHRKIRKELLKVFSSD